MNAPPTAAAGARAADRRTSRVNDFAIKIATVNGTGSASANGMLMQAIFRMGVPISGKNVFPSNIQGLPTWYEIRVNGDGHTARTPIFDIFIAMNPQTYAKDLETVAENGWFLYDSTWPFDPELLSGRPDVTPLGIPLAKLCQENFKGSRTRILLKNIAYVGALVALLDLDMEVVEGMLNEKFAKKAHLLEANRVALKLGGDYAREHFACPLPIRVESLDKTSDHIMIDGNTAAGLGCVFAGATVAAWYPITPSTSLVDGFTKFAERYRTNEDGTRNVIIMQAEDELSAAGMTIGAGWAGARSFTSTSGAGISLMNEFLGLAYYAEIPSVFFNIMRTGPSTGMPTRTQQGDIFSTAYASHGDTAHICIYPADPGECFTMSADAFDLAERYQTPVFVVSDLDIGMNDWMVPRFSWDDDYVPDRGKVLSADELETMEAFYRYLDVDGDEIPYRTLPGVHPKGAYFTRGSGHDKYGRYTEDSVLYQEVVDRLKRKVNSSGTTSPQPIIERQEGAQFSIVTIGGCDRAVREAIAHWNEEGVAVDFMRVRAFPFSPAVEEFLREHDDNYIVEQNRDGQLHRMLLLETDIEKKPITSVTSYNGLPLSAHHVRSGIERKRA
ncbi:MAG: 2-oxoacid:acceptor oxidoreductase subunit alpha [Deltaproteobacteria bacterium]|nr:2-oxoacid:acceptor oxidoreductase subunit alpha [Deltaproteobacteria bacterium]